MSERDFAMALAMLAEAFGEKGLTPVRIEAYHRALGDVPMPVLTAGVQKAIETRSWFPKVAELRQDCEAARQALRASRAYEPCLSCEMTPGWISVTEGNVQRLRRCVCWTAHVERVAALGAGEKVLALPAGRDEGEY